MSQFSKGLPERRLAFIDRNKELWLCPVVPPAGGTSGKGKTAAAAKHKLHTQASRAAWLDWGAFGCTVLARSVAIQYRALARLFSLLV